MFFNANLSSHGDAVNADGPEIAPGSGVPLATSPGSPGFAMGLAVPGLTVPWSHAGYLWLATAASIAFHLVR